MAEVKQPSHFNRPSVSFQLIPHGRAEALLLTHYYCDSFVHTKMNWGKGTFMLLLLACVAKAS